MSLQAEDVRRPKSGLVDPHMLFPVSVSGESLKRGKEDSSTRHIWELHHVCDMQVIQIRTGQTHGQTQPVTEAEQGDGGHLSGFFKISRLPGV